MLVSNMALSGVLMALLRRQTTGKGDYVDIAMMDALMASLPNGYGLPMTGGRQPVAKNERTWGGNAMYRVYETADGRFVALGGAEIKFATNLLTALGRPDLVPLCKEPPGAAQDPVRDFLTDTFLTRTQAAWVDWMEGKDIAFAPVKTLREGLDDPQARHRGMVMEDARHWEHLGIPLTFADEPGEVRFDPPAHGQHSEEILSWLGYSPVELAAMKAGGII